MQDTGRNSNKDSNMDNDMNNNANNNVNAQPPFDDKRLREMYDKKTSIRFIIILLLILVEEHVIRYIISRRLIMEIMPDNGMMI